MDRKDTSNDITEKNSNKNKKNICNFKKYDGTIIYIMHVAYIMKRILKCR